MLNFIVCEDNKIILQKNINIINKTMFNNNINYKIHPFTEYNDDLKKLIKEKNMKKIYILDIELKNISGIEISRKIRENDLDSFIIISTAHTEYLPYTLKSKLLIYNFISKFDNYEACLSNEIRSILDIYPESKILDIEIRNKHYNIHYNEILYIKYDNNKRKTIIKTEDNKYEVSIPMISITKDLDDRFVKIKDRFININKVKDSEIINNQLI